MKTSIEIIAMLDDLGAEYTYYGGSKTYFVITGPEDFDASDLPEYQTDNGLLPSEGVALVVAAEGVDDNGEIDWEGIKEFCGLYAGQ